MGNKNINIKKGNEGEKKMAVSKAGVPVMDSYLGEKLIEDIKKTKLNDKLVDDCRMLLKSLIEKRKR